MKILVSIKRVIDPYVKIRIKADQSTVETQNVKMAMNPFDEIALEEAIRCREKNLTDEVVIVSVGNDAVQETLRQGLALGADRAILVRTSESYCSLNIAKILSAMISREQPSLVLMGKQAIDGDHNQTPQMLAGILGWPQATFASSLMMTENHAEVTREVDGGLETLDVTLPAVISCDLRLNEPRYATLPNIMKSKQKPLEIIELDSLGLNLKQHKKIVSVKAPATRVGGIKVDSIAELIDKLQHEAKVL